MQSIKAGMSIVALAGALTAAAPKAHAGFGEDAVKFVEDSVKGIGSWITDISVKLVGETTKTIQAGSIACTEVRWNSSAALIVAGGCAVAAIVYANQSAFCYRAKVDHAYRMAKLRLKYKNTKTGQTIDQDVDALDAKDQKDWDNSAACSTLKADHGHN